MKELNKEELMQVEGGFLLNNTILSTLIRGANTFADIGRSLGSSLRRLFTSCLC